MPTTPAGRRPIIGTTFPSVLRSTMHGIGNIDQITMRRPHMNASQPVWATIAFVRWLPWSMRLWFTIEMSRPSVMCRIPIQIEMISRVDASGP